MPTAPSVSTAPTVPFGLTVRVTCCTNWPSVPPGTILLRSDRSIPASLTGCRRSQVCFWSDVGMTTETCPSPAASSPSATATRSSALSSPGATPAEGRITSIASTSSYGRRTAAHRDPSANLAGTISVMPGTSVGAPPVGVNGTGHSLVNGVRHLAANSTASCSTSCRSGVTSIADFSISPAVCLLAHASSTAFAPSRSTRSTPES